MAIVYKFPTIQGTASDRTGGTWTNLPAGWLFVETDTGLLYYWTGSAWTLITEKSLAETITGAKTFNDQTLKRRNPADTFTLTEIHPAITANRDHRFYEPYTYLIQKEGTTTYAKKGVTGEIISSNTDSSTVIQAAIDALTSSGGSIYIAFGVYTIVTKLDIPGAIHGVHIIMENAYTELSYTGTDACLEVGGTGTQTVGFELTNGRLSCASTTGTPVGLRMINLNHARIYNARINGISPGTSTGIELNGGANFNGDIQMYGVYLHGHKLGIKVTNGAANATCIFGGAIFGHTGPVAGSIGIDKDGGDTWQVYGVDIESMETAIRESTTDAPYGSSIFDMRVENCTNYVTTGTSNNRFGGSTTSTIITDTGTNNEFTVPTFLKFYRQRIMKFPSVRKSGINHGTAIYEGILNSLSAAAGGTSIANVNSTLGRYVTHDTGAVSGQNAGWRMPSVSYRKFNPRFKIQMATTTTLNQAGWWGWSSVTTDPTGDTEATAKSYFAVGFRSTDTTYQIIRNDGSTPATYVDTTVTINTTVRTWELIGDDSNARFGWSVDGGPVTYYTTIIPASTTLLTLVAQMETNTTTAKNWNQMFVEYESDK